MKISKVKKFNIITVICSVFLAFGLCFVFAFSSSTAVTETNLSSTPSFCLYCVSTAKSQLESEAVTLGKDNMKSGGGGYVWKKENYFYVISSAYENKNDAMLVSADLENNNVKNEVVEFQFDLINLSSPINSPEAKSTFNAAINMFISAYKDLFDISVCLDTNIYDETNAFLEINRIQAKADEIMKNFHLVFKDCSSAICDSLEKAIISTNEAISHLADNKKEFENQPLLSQIRYCYTKTCAVYADFLENID